MPKKYVLPVTFLLISILVILAYANVVFWGKSLNPVLFIPSNSNINNGVEGWNQLRADDTRVSSGYVDIQGSDSKRHGWQVDLANPAYLEWPVNLFIGRALKAGYIPVVLPYQSLGVPLIGQYCHRVLSPYQIIENIFLPYGYDFFLLGRLILAGFFTWLFIRPLCRKNVSALMAGIGYGLGGIMVIYSNHEEVSNVALTLPILMWGIRAFFDRPGISRVAGLALALALVHTAGQPEIQLYILFLAFLYGCLRLFILPRGEKLRALFWCLGAILVSGLIAAPQIYLFLRFHQEAWTFHPPGGEIGLQSPILAKEFIFSFFPKFRQTHTPWAYRTMNYTWDWVGGYFGIGMLFLAAAAFRHIRKHPTTMLFGLYFLFILAKNLGWSPAQLLGLLPFFDQTWSPRWAAATWSFSLAVLAGLGLDNLLNFSPKDLGENAVLDKPRYRWTLRASLGFGGLLVMGLFLLRLSLLSWTEANLKMFVFSSGIGFILLVRALVLLFNQGPDNSRKFFQKQLATIQFALKQNQFGMISLLAGMLALSLHWLPSPHYSFFRPPALASYLGSAPLLLISLSGLFFMAAYPAQPITVIGCALAIPSALLAGTVPLPQETWQIIYMIALAVTAGGILWRPQKYDKYAKFIFMSLAGITLLGLIYFAWSSTDFFSLEQPRLIRFYYYFGILLILFFAGLSLRIRKGKLVNGWFYLLPVWAELSLYIPKNHVWDYLLLDALPFVLIAATLICSLMFSRKHTQTNFKITIVSAFLLGMGGMLVLESITHSNLPPRGNFKKNLPFVDFLKDKNPGAITGIGRVLAPNFATAHGLTDLRGCVSMNTTSYQFFIENILEAVPPDNSFSLWFTGENPVKKEHIKAYSSSRTYHRDTFERLLEFYRLAGARYILTDLGLLDQVGHREENQMKRIYRHEVDIWEIPALPPAYIAHQAQAVSMKEEPEAWKTAMLEPEVMAGKKVILEKEYLQTIPESTPALSDRAILVQGDNPNLFRIKFHSLKPGFLVINRGYTNLLRAYLNGIELPVLEANGPFIAIPIPGGEQDRELIMSYVSSEVRLSFIVGGLGLLIVLGTFIFLVLRKKPGLST